MMLAIEFGSGMRGDNDLTSDRDLLLIGSDWQKITSESAIRSAAGFSISAFLFDKASYLVSSGNLFFKHICDEGVLLSGSEDSYRALISGWRPGSDYCDEVKENIDLLEIIHFIPLSSAGIAAVIDIIISSVRNILIRRLASGGEYVFSWNQIFDAARKRQMIKCEDVQLFLSARSLKNRYRQGYISHLSISYLDALFEASNRAFGVKLRPRFARRSEIRSLPERYVNGTYKQLRALELMCAEYSFDSALDPLMDLVRRPAYFCANGPNTMPNRPAENAVHSKLGRSDGCLSPAR